jgi:pimeloyl-ACP methyl ester carboxylesterase
MPRQRVGDIEIYYEVHGDGPQTLVMIRGLGSNLTAWYEQTPEFACHFRTVVFDNRGAGRTDKPDAPYSIRQMADDTAGLMEALGIRRAALLGISMGGMIAQEFALAHQERLSCLILGCTNFGGSGIARADANVVAAVVAGEKANAEQRKLQTQAAFCDETIASKPGVIDKHNRVRMQYLIPPFSFMRQVAAIGQFDVSARLGEIRVPTLVLAGSGDRLVPPANSRMLVQRIPGAALRELPGGHLFMIEYPSEFNSAVIEFVKAHA